MAYVSYDAVQLMAHENLVTSEHHTTHDPCVIWYHTAHGSWEKCNLLMCRMTHGSWGKCSFSKCCMTHDPWEPSSHDPCIVWRCTVLYASWVMGVCCLVPLMGHGNKVAEGAPKSMSHLQAFCCSSKVLSLANAELMALEFLSPSECPSSFPFLSLIYCLPLDTAQQVIDFIQTIRNVPQYFNYECLTLLCLICIADLPTSSSGLTVFCRGWQGWRHHCHLASRLKLSLCQQLWKSESLHLRLVVGWWGWSQ